MADLTEIRNGTTGIVTLPETLSGVVLGPGRGVSVNLTESVVIAGLGGEVPQGLTVRTVPIGQPITAIPTPPLTEVPDPFTPTDGTFNIIGALDTTTGVTAGAAIETTAGIGAFGVTAPVSQPAKIADPTGGVTIDAESRTAINAIIDALEGAGISAAV